MNRNISFEALKCPIKTKKTLKGQKLTGDRNHGSIYMNIFKSVIRTFLTDFLHNYRILSIHIFCTKKVGSDTAFHITILPSVEKLKKTEHKTK